MDDVCGARRLPVGVSEQFCGRLPSQTGEPGEQRLAGGLGQIPRGCQALCQPHHQAEVSQVHQTQFVLVLVILFLTR